MQTHLWREEYLICNMQSQCPMMNALLEYYKIFIKMRTKFYSAVVKLGQ